MTEERESRVRGETEETQEEREEGHNRDRGETEGTQEKNQKRHRSSD